MDKNRVLKKNSNMVTRMIEDETILMPLYKTSVEIDCIYTLNNVAARIWELIDGKKTLKKIQKMLLEEFDITEGELDKELVKFLKDLEEIKAIS